MEIFYSMAESVVNVIVGGPGSKLTPASEKETLKRGQEIQEEM